MALPGNALESAVSPMFIPRLALQFPLGFQGGGSHRRRIISALKMVWCSHPDISLMSREKPGKSFS
jgi:hypothetical protein